MTQNIGEIPIPSKERLFRAKYEYERLRSMSNRGDVDPENLASHRAAEDSARQELEAAKEEWYRLDPDNAPNPKSNPYIYPEP